MPGAKPATALTEAKKRTNARSRFMLVFWRQENMDGTVYRYLGAGGKSRWNDLLGSELMGFWCCMLWDFWWWVGAPTHDKGSVPDLK